MNYGIKYQIYKAFAEKYNFKPLSFLAWGSLNKTQLSAHISKIISQSN